MLKISEGNSRHGEKFHDFQDVPTPWIPGQPTAVPILSGDMPKGAGRSAANAHGRIEEHQITCPLALMGSLGLG